MKATETAPTPTPEPDDYAPIVYLDPARVMADDNSRFSLRPEHVDKLKESILAVGEVLQPVEVETLEGHEDYDYSLTSGFGRHAAVTQLNKGGAGLALPAIVRDVANPVDRLKHQLAENMARENQSPMDKAMAMSKLMEAGVSRGEVRRIFSTVGGRKGNTLSPMANGMLNIYLNLLTLPKSIQQKIHDGLVGVGAAYELGKAAPERRDAILQEAERVRLKQVEQEEKDEEKFIAAESRAAAAREKEEAAKGDVEKAKAEIAKVAELVKEKTTALRAAQKLYTEGKKEDAKTRGDLTEHLNAAMADLKAAQKLDTKAKNDLAKLKMRMSQAEAIAAPKPKKPAAKAKPIGATDIKRAAKKMEKDTDKKGHVALSLQEVRECLKDFDKEGVGPRTAQVGKAFRDAFNGIGTPKDLIRIIGIIVGEVKVK